MFEFPEKLKEAITYFCKFPGVGEKTATRQVLTLTNWTAEEINSYSRAIKSLCDLEKCQECGLFADDGFCSVCSSQVRKNSKQICIVESISDAMAIERSGQYHGLYHVLGGVLNPLMGIGPDDLDIDKLMARIRDGKIEEAILAVNPSVEGDATSSYIKHQIIELNVGYEIIVERIGFGVPIGGSLEYLDPLTISKSLENKRAL